MSVIEEISRMSKVGCSDRELLEYIDKHYGEIECELSMKMSMKKKKLEMSMKNPKKKQLEMSMKNPKSAIVIFAWVVN